jgi:cell division protein ZapA
LSDTTHDDPAVTPVNIYGRTYQLRGNEDGEYLAELASLVDGRMRDVADATGTADTLKVAILAALNIADEYLQAGKGKARTTDRGAADKKLARMITLLDEVLTS